MADNKAATKVVTGKVRLSYVHLFDPWANADDETPKYSATLLIPKGDTVTLDKIRAAQAAALEIGKGKHFGGKVPKDLTYTMHDGDVKVEEDELAPDSEYAGHYYMAVSSRQRPGIVDLALNKIENPTLVYSGCYARVSLGFYAFNTKGKKGISAGLNNVQFIADGDPLGGMTRATDDFGDGFDGGNLGDLL